MSQLKTNKKDDDVVMVAAKRTPFGSFGGSLASKSATDLAELASFAALKQAGVEGSVIDATIFGNVCQSSRDAIYLARHVGLRVGVPIKSPALNVNRLCASGFEAIVQGAYSIKNEDYEMLLVGGTESMSQIPYVSRSARFGKRLGHDELEDFLMASLTDEYVGLPMAVTAENIAKKYNISRMEVDEYALLSQQRAAKAWEEGIFRDEVFDVDLSTSKKKFVFSKDEHIKVESSMEGLQKLRPVFDPAGLVTAGNASGMCDGACALILSTRKKAKALGLKVLASLQSWGVSGCKPEEMGMGPVGSSAIAIKRFNDQHGAAFTIDSFDLIEINEAFSAQYLGVEKEMKLDRKKTNIHGGAIAVGHPLGASGARLTSHLIYGLSGQKGFGLASACVGGGQGMTIIIEVE